MNTPPKALALSPADESAIRTVVSEFASTWNSHDMVAMHELDTEDVEWVNVTGNHWRGKADVYKGHDNLHTTIFARTEMTIDSATIRLIDSEVAIAVAAMTFGPVTIPTGQEIPTLKTRGSFTLVKHDGAWKIAHFHNTSVDAEAERNDPLSWDATGYLPGRPTSA